MSFDETIKADTIKVYVLNIEKLDGEDDRLLSVIAPHYAQKYERIRVPRGKKEELGAGFLLARYLGVTRDDQLTFNEYGKPMLNMEVNKHFSLSHSGQYVILATSDSPVGIDIERVDRLNLNVLKRVLPPTYYERLEKEENNNTKLSWGKSWTSVEAILKADGKGFNIDPRKDDNFMEGWHIESFNLGEEYMVSCASKKAFVLKIVNVEDITI